MDGIYFIKSPYPDHDNLKVLNEAGDELSLAGDDSCGVFPHNSRLQLAVFAKNNERVGEEQYYVTPESFLKALASHLGYKVEKL